MVDRNILAIHGRIDEEHFELHMLTAAVRSLQQRVIILESEIRALRREELDRQDPEPIRRNRTA